METVFLGSVLREKTWSEPGAGIAMSKWLKGLFDGLKENNTKPLVVGHIYEASWPKGRFWANPHSYLDQEYVTDPLRFSNLPFIRTPELSILYLRRIQKLFRNLQQSNPVLFTYNPYPWHLPAARWWQRKGGIWINIVLDYNENDLGEEWRSFISHCGDADGQVFLSWYGYKHCPVERKLHLDSGCGKIHFSQHDNGDWSKKIVLYAGKVEEHGGAGLMGKAFSLLQGKDIEFHVFGRGKNSLIEESSNGDPRIKIHGYVEEATLEQWCRKAYVFINPRDPSYSENKLIFPSKILYYLSYGKPVVSTWTEGLSPSYRDLLSVVDDSSPESFASAINRVVSMPFSACRQWKMNIYKALTGDLSWQNQAYRLLEFAKEVRKNTSQKASP